LKRDNETGGLVNQTVMCFEYMKYFFAIFFFVSTANASEVRESKITPQDVMTWNNVNLVILAQISEDLKIWCNLKFEIHCEGVNAKTFLSIDRSTVFYQFNLDGVDDIVAVYSEKNGVIEKSWVSEWEYPFVVKPFESSAE